MQDYKELQKMHSLSGVTTSYFDCSDDDKWSMLVSLVSNAMALDSHMC